MGKKLRRKPCDGTQCHDPVFFNAPSKSPAAGPFFKTAAGDVPDIQKDDAPATAEEEKDPLTEGLKTTGGQLLDHEPFKKWYDPKLKQLKLEFWDKASTGEKAAMISFLGLNLGLFGGAFAVNPQLQKSLSDVNIGKPLGWIPYSPIEGFKYKLPDAGKTGTGFSADFTLNPYLELVTKRYPWFPLTGTTFSLDSTYDPKGRGFGLTGGKLGLDFFGGGLTASGSIFNQSSISPYPMFFPGAPGMPPTTLMQQVPGAPDLKTGPGYGGMLNLDLVKMYDFVHKKDRKK